METVLVIVIVGVVVIWIGWSADKVISGKTRPYRIGNLTFKYVRGINRSPGIITIQRLTTG